MFGLFKNEAVAPGSPFRSGPLRHLADVEALSLNHVHWTTTTGSTTSMGDLSPEEFELAFYAQLHHKPAGAAAHVAVSTRSGPTMTAWIPANDATRDLLVRRV